MFEVDNQGVFFVRFGDIPEEPVCPYCNQPIKWVLDMYSLQTMVDGKYKLAHARCLWTRDAFYDQAKLAPDH